jgi:hypothetical protein
LGIVAFIVVGILGVVPHVGAFLPTGLGGPGRALALGIPGPDPVVPIVSTVVLIGAAGLASWLAFRRQEL